MHTSHQTTNSPHLPRERQRQRQTDRQTQRERKKDANQSTEREREGERERERLFLMPFSAVTCSSSAAPFEEGGEC